MVKALHHHARPWPVTAAPGWPPSPNPPGTSRPGIRHGGDRYPWQRGCSISCGCTYPIIMVRYSIIPSSEGRSQGASTPEAQHLLRHLHLEYLPAIAHVHFDPGQFVGENGIKVEDVGAHLEANIARWMRSIVPAMACARGLLASLRRCQPRPRRPALGPAGGGPTRPPGLSHAAPLSMPRLRPQTARGRPAVVLCGPAAPPRAPP
jgi:hypothetical protein